MQVIDQSRWWISQWTRSIDAGNCSISRTCYWRFPANIICTWTKWFHSSRTFILHHYKPTWLCQLMHIKRSCYYHIITNKSAHQTTLSPRFNGHFPVASGLACTRTSPFWILLELRMTDVVQTTAAIRCAKLLSNHHRQQTNI